MTKFHALVSSAEGTHSVMIEANSVSDAKEQLELDFGKGAVSVVEPYSAENVIDPEKQQLRDKDVSEFSKSHRRNKPARLEKKRKPNIEFQTMALVIASLVLPALLLLAFGSPFISWYHGILALLPN